jgi:hypothetical protein
MRPVATSLATLLCTMAVNAYGGFCGGALNVNTGQGFAAIPNAKAVWTPNNGDITVCFLPALCSTRVPRLTICRLGMYQIRRKISTQSSLFDCTDACWNRDSLDTSKSRPIQASLPAYRS